LRGLVILGGIGPETTAVLPPDTACLLLLGPDGPSWPETRRAPEFGDGAPDPLDRWSRRVIGSWAEDIGAAALYPFDGPPWHPFHRWALATGRAVTSPVGFLCHVDQGVMVSYRGALALPFWPDGLAGAAPDPCAACPDQPCRTACPAGALTVQDYDVDACRGWLDTDGADCLSGGCLVRRACPLSADAQRDPEQSAFHMRAFNR
jgi:hypothetical protein